MDAKIGKKFIVFEGIDGCGKSTQTKLLGEYFEAKGITHYLTREPISTGVGKYLREEILSGTISLAPMVQAYLFAAARAQNIFENVLPNLEGNNKFVFCDRHLDSSIVYQGIILGLGEALVRQINAPATSLVAPEITFIIDITPEESMKRIGLRSEKNKEIFEKLETMKIARLSYLSLAKANPSRTFYKIINGMNSQTEIQAEIRKFIGAYYSI